MKKLIYLWKKFIHSFPVQLWINNIKHNHILTILWIILMIIVMGHFGNYLGIPYLFLDPEYLDQVSFTSFYITGTSLAIFCVAFQITCYINDGPRFSFLGTLPRPFSHFAFNNSIFPIVFVVIYIIEIIIFQLETQQSSVKELMIYLAGFISGLVFTTILYFVYFWLTNKDAMRYLAHQLDQKLRRNIRITRIGAMNKLDIARKEHPHVDSYLSYNFRFHPTNNTKGLYDRQTIIKVFDQNHFNLITLQFFIFGIISTIAVFRDYPILQIPAAASLLIFLTMLISLVGAFSYWFGSWSATAGLIFFLILNEIYDASFFFRSEKAFGIKYEGSPATYSTTSLHMLSSPEFIHQDKQRTLDILEQWRKKFPKDVPPQMIFTAVSGGGKRAALWALVALQTADSLTQGKFLEHTALITGASGGLIGASYFREIKLRQKKGEAIDPYDSSHQMSIAKDNLNSLIFSFLANGLFVNFNHFNYKGEEYIKDRAFAFEENLNTSTHYLMDKPISAYKSAEEQALIPLIILSPTIANDGRKLYIASQPVSYMNAETINTSDYENNQIGGVDFRELLSNHHSDSLRFLSALRMNASFPYITPNTVLPTSPPIEIIDAGVSDNIGVSTAIRFIYAFKDWIEKNTSGVILLSIRDDRKLTDIRTARQGTLVNNIIKPIGDLYNNLENFQDIQNDVLVGHAASWLACPIKRIEIECIPMQKNGNRYNTSLSWHLTEKEKQNIIASIKHPKNTRMLDTLRRHIL